MEKKNAKKRKKSANSFPSLQIPVMKKGGRNKLFYFYVCKKYYYEKNLSIIL